MAPAGGGEGGADPRHSRSVGADRGASLVLASGSPQRRELLARLDVPFTVRVSEADELEQGEDAAAVAVENALRKARAARRPGVGPGAWAAETVLACDTVVVLDGVIYGKPADAAAARETLAALGGRTHEVISGVALLLAGTGSETEERTAVARTRVTFRALDAELLDWYVATEEWRGRSGGYAIQGAGERLALSIDGEVENVVGLPLRTLRALAPELFES
ncbi:MAG TPA: Maf family protein [Solirubrobacteraceae bacterium]|jgi:septum formation protein|nr:Maf family protein [Solirubrobacteraceae bacterium]